MREENGKRDSPEPQDRHTSLRSYLSTTNLLSTEQLFYNSKVQYMYTLYLFMTVNVSNQVHVKSCNSFVSQLYNFSIFSQVLCQLYRVHVELD